MTQPAPEAVVVDPQAPQSYADLRRTYARDEDCLALLEELRWPDGFRCPECGADAAWRMGAGERRCQGCRRRVSATTGTVLHGTRTPLPDWFAAAWLLTQDPRGVSARELRRRLGLGSYQTAWAMLHRLRTAMAPTPSEKLAGRIHLDEVLLGRRAAGVPGRGVRGLQLTAIAVQPATATTPERVRLGVLSESSPASLRTFLHGAVERGSTVVTDGWAAYPPACRRLFVHERHLAGAPGQRGHATLASVAAVDRALNRWLVGTHLASVRPAHLQNYLDEFTFRWNHDATGPDADGRPLFLALLARAAGAQPLSYRQIVGSPRLAAPTQGVRA